MAVSSRACVSIYIYQASSYYGFTYSYVDPRSGTFHFPYRYSACVVRVERCDAQTHLRNVDFNKSSVRSQNASGCGLAGAQQFRNVRAGRGLPDERRGRLEEAKDELQALYGRQDGGTFDPPFSAFPDALETAPAGVGKKIRSGRRRFLPRQRKPKDFYIDRGWQSCA